MKSKHKLYGAMLFFAPMSLMAGEFDSSFGSIMGLVAKIAYCGCAFFILDGILNMNQGKSYTRDIIGLAITAGSFAICKLIFTAFGMGDAVIAPIF